MRRARESDACNVDSKATTGLEQPMQGQVADRC